MSEGEKKRKIKYELLAHRIMNFSSEVDGQCSHSLVFLEAPLFLFLSLSLPLSPRYLTGNDRPPSSFPNTATNQNLNLTIGFIALSYKSKRNTNSTVFAAAMTQLIDTVVVWYLYLSHSLTPSPSLFPLLSLYPIHSFSLAKFCYPRS